MAITDIQIDAAIPTTNTGTVADRPSRTSVNGIVKTLRGAVYNRVALTAALSSASGVVTIDCATSAYRRTITLTENVTSWVFSNRPASGEFRDLYLEITQDAVTAYTVALPTGDKVAGGHWVMPPTLGASITVGVHIGNTTTKWFPGGEDYTI